MLKAKYSYVGLVPPPPRRLYGLIRTLSFSPLGPIFIAISVTPCAGRAVSVTIRTNASNRVKTYVTRFESPSHLELAHIAWWGGCTFKRLVPPLPQQLALALGGVTTPGPAVGTKHMAGGGRKIPSIIL